MILERIDWIESSPIKLNFVDSALVGVDDPAAGWNFFLFSGSVATKPTVVGLVGRGQCPGMVPELSLLAQYFYCFTIWPGAPRPPRLCL
jgi:hypothetical protein